jgi:hypothetical protein
MAWELLGVSLSFVWDLLATREQKKNHEHVDGQAVE